MHLADWVPTLLGLAGVEPPTGEIILKWGYDGRVNNNEPPSSEIALNIADIWL